MNTSETIIPTGGEVSTIFVLMSIHATQTAFKYFEPQFLENIFNAVILDLFCKADADQCEQTITNHFYFRRLHKQSQSMTTGYDEKIICNLKVGVS